MGKSLDLCYRSQLKRMRLPEDRISPLPDEILLIILSSLTVKEMLETSTLSSRWLNLWVNTPVLDFQGPISDDSRFYHDKNRNNFVEWVNHVLRQHKCHYLKKFRIEFNLNKHHQKDVDRWLKFALTRKVEILELSFLVPGCLLTGTPFYYDLPDCFSSGKANLDGSERSRFLQFELKCLKSLSLKYVGVTDEAINSFLANCPFLERLEVVGSGYSTNLGHILSQNPTFLPQLEALTLIALGLREVIGLSSNLAHLTKLKRLVIKVGANGDESLTALFSLVKSCHHLEEFVLTTFWIKPERTSRTMCEVERHSSKSKCLKVFEFKGYHGRVCDMEFIMHIVENAPGLEKIIIETCNLTMGKRDCSVINSEKEARSIALNQFKHLRESESIPPHVDVLIR